MITVDAGYNNSGMTCNFYSTEVEISVLYLMPQYNNFFFCIMRPRFIVYAIIIKFSVTVFTKLPPLFNDCITKPVGQMVNCFF